MKKYIVTILTIICILSLVACGKDDTYEIEIIIPAGSTEAFVYSDEEISPIGNKITISAWAGIADTEVILKPVNENLENGYVAEYLTQGMPVKLDAVKGEWFKIGVAMQNDSDRDITVAVKVAGVEVRIADTDDFLEANDFSRDEIKLGLENVADSFGLSSIAKMFLTDL